MTFFLNEVYQSKVLFYLVRFQKWKHPDSAWLVQSWRRCHLFFFKNSPWFHEDTSEVYLSMKVDIKHLFQVILWKYPFTMILIIC